MIFRIVNEVTIKCDEELNTEDVISQNKLRAQISIQHADIYIEMETEDEE